MDQRRDSTRERLERFGGRQGRGCAGPQVRTRAACLVVGALFVLLGGLTPVGAQTGSGGTNSPHQRDKPYVVLVSLDGFKAEYLDQYTLPNLQRVMRRGTRAKSMVPVFPTLTFPNHYSLVTGLHPARHGIVSNRFFDPERRQTFMHTDRAAVTDGSWYRGEPIWVTAERQGMVTACFFWPGSEAAIRGVRPTIWNSYDGTIPNPDRVKKVLEWLRMPVDRRPHLVTLYFSDLDSASHEGILESGEVEQAAQALDRSIGALLDGIDALPTADRTYLLITSDHGMVSASGNQAIPLESLLKPTELADIESAFGGAVGHLHVRGGAERGRQLRDRINSTLARGTAYLRSDVPERFHHRDDPRAGDLVIVMDEAWTISITSPASDRAGEATAPARPTRKRSGQHGWDNSLPSMRALFLALGPHVRQGAVIGDVNNVDVYPLIAEWLGLRPSDRLDGRAGVIQALLRK